MSAFLHTVEKEKLFQQFLDFRLQNSCLPESFRQIPSPRKIKSTKVIAELENQSSGKGKWNRAEQIAYVDFLDKNIEDMSTKLARKSRKVFLNMALLVKSRSADQCRSHHQKVLNYHKSVQEIIRYYREDVFPFVDEMRENMKSKKEEELQTKADDSRTSGKPTEDLFKVTAVGSSFKIDILCSAILEY